MKEQSNQVRAGGAISGVENHFFEKPQSRKANLIEHDMLPGYQPATRGIEMAGIREVLLMRFVPERAQAGLALLRVWTGGTLFFRHGLEKQPAHWAQFLAHFPDPIGIGSHASFFVAFFSDFVCGMLLMIGLGTRWAALYCFGNIFVAWAFVHHFAYFGKGPASDHGELMVLYLGALLTLLLAGPGAPSVDRALERKP